ncbi:hypothetical protein, partial [Tritonibacter sp. SIMBA_163]|uniref:hypothetical protein n=1 Tax=Tritonibacter sp. SIMBA_163 TaxID=3080868 RepID=UPI0039804039
SRRAARAAPLPARSRAAAAIVMASAMASNSSNGRCPACDAGPLVLPRVSFGEDGGEQDGGPGRPGPIDG